MTDAVMMTLEREDHTLGNMLRMQLLEDKEVSVAARAARMLGKVGSLQAVEPSVCEGISNRGNNQIE